MNYANYAIFETAKDNIHRIRDRKPNDRHHVKIVWPNGSETHYAFEFLIELEKWQLWADEVWNESKSDFYDEIEKPQVIICDPFPAVCEFCDEETPDDYLSGWFREHDVVCCDSCDTKYNRETICEGYTLVGDQDVPCRACRE